MRRSRVGPSLRAAIALGAIAAAGLGGCGGDSGARGFAVRADTTMTTAASLTKAEFVTRINRACRDEWGAIHENFVQFSQEPPPEHRGGHRYANAVRLTFVAGLDFYVFDTIYDLGAPPGEEGRLEELLGAMQEPVETTQRGLAPIRTPAELEAHFARYNRLARAYGLDDCLVAGGHVPATRSPDADGR